MWIYRYIDSHTHLCLDRSHWDEYIYVHIYYLVDGRDFVAENGQCALMQLGHLRLKLFDLLLHALLSLLLLPLQPPPLLLGSLLLVLLVDFLLLLLAPGAVEEGVQVQGQPVPPLM